MRSASTLYLIFYVLLTSSTASSKPFDLQEAFSKEQQLRIVRDKSFFQRDQDKSDSFFDPKSELDPFFKDRINEHSFDEFLETVLKEGLLVHYEKEKLCLADAKCHLSLSSLIPSLKIDLDFSSQSFLKGFLAFLSPKKWKNYFDAKKTYQISQYLFLKEILDESSRLEVFYIQVHEQIQEYKIIQFLLAHLKLLEIHITNAAQAEESEVREPLLEKKLISLELELEKRRVSIKGLLGELNVKSDCSRRDEGDYSSDESLNIRPFLSKSKFEQKALEIQEKFQDRNTFVEAAMIRSLELQSFQILYEIAKRDPRLISVGEVFSVEDDYPGINLSYGIFPKFMIIKSKSAQAALDVKHEIMTLIQKSRSSYDLMNMNLNLHRTAKSLSEKTEDFLKINLESSLKAKKIDLELLESLEQSLSAQLEENSILHDIMRSISAVDRLLGAKKEFLVRFLPHSEQIQDTLDKMISFYSQEEQVDLLLDNTMRKIYKTDELSLLLAGDCIKIQDLYYNFSKEDLVRAVKRNIHNLLHPQGPSPKNDHFFKILSDFIERNQIFPDPKSLFLCNRDQIAPTF